MDDHEIDRLGRSFPNLMLVAFSITCVFALSVLLTGQVRRHALRSALLDIPNRRSSHKVPTPRGGGLAIAISSLFGVAVLFALGVLGANLSFALSGGGLAVAVAGYLDDRGKIGIGTRIAIHFAAAIWAVSWIGGLSELQFGSVRIELGAAGWLISVLSIVWALNLFNFMDGIDGIAAGEAVFVALAAGLLAELAGIGSSTSSATFMFAAAAMGFLVWNWPPARIFMGDVGSGYLGFYLALVALAAAAQKPAFLNVFLVLSAVFIVDATVTLLRRLARRERVYEPHRSHAYQWLARRWESHARVTMAIMAINFLWLAPLAWACIAKPSLTVIWLFAALIPLAVLALLSGAGRRE